MTVIEFSSTDCDAACYQLMIQYSKIINPKISSSKLNEIWFSLDLKGVIIELKDLTEEESFVWVSYSLIAYI